MRSVVRSVLIPSVLLILGESVASQNPAYHGQSATREETVDRLKVDGWWPTKTNAARADFLGPKECATCHSDEANTWSETPMAHASVRASDAPLPFTAKPFLFASENLRYELGATSDGVSLSVTKGVRSKSVSLLWAFGVGRRGQTYIYESDGAFYESHLSYYRSLDGLEITSGHETLVPSEVDNALGLRLERQVAEHCFRCHTTASVTSTGFDPEKSFAGVTCEACHGPGAKHVSAMKAGHLEEGRNAILNPRYLNPVASVEFCGACHRTWADAAWFANEIVGVRFQPYRLEESRCWGDGDARLNCTACHNPHKPLTETLSSYDKNCLVCHARASQALRRIRRTRSCRVGTRNCVTCHMPQTVIPSMHSRFTDHRIRIVRNRNASESRKSTSPPRRP